MKSYLILFIIMFSIQFMRARTEKAYLYRCLLTFLPFFLFGALRIDCGDYESYEVFYEATHSSGSYLWANERIEWGFAFLNYLMPSYRYLIVVTSLFISFAYAYFFYKFIPQKYSWLAVIFLFLSADKSIYFMLGAMRNSTAIAMLMLAATFIRDRKWVLMTVTVLIASLFHNSALIFLPLAYFIARSSKMGKTEFFIWLAAMIILVITPISTFLDQITPYVDLYFERYEKYVEEGRDAGTLVTIGSVLMALPALLFVFNDKELTKSENTMGRLALCFMYSYFLGSLNMRISHYFVPFLLPFITSFFEKNKNALIRNGYVIYCGLFLAYALFVVSASNVNSPFILYKTIFD